MPYLPTVNRGVRVLIAETITDEGSLERLVPEWEALDRSLTPRLPFTSPRWCMLWWRLFRRNGAMKRDELRTYALREPDGTLVAVAPMMLTRRPAVGPLQSRELQFLGADSYMTEFRGPICQPARAHEVCEALRRLLAGRDHQSWHWIQWRGLPSMMQTEPSLRAQIATGSESCLTSHYLELPSSWEALKAKLPRNIKESIRKCYNSLTRDGHSFEFRVVSCVASVGEAVRIFLELHRARSEKSGTIDHIDVFSTEEARHFLSEYVRAEAEADRIRIFQLVIGGRVVATRIGFVLGDEIYLYYSGYAVEWARYSVMTTVVAEAIRWSIDNGMRIVNLSTGTDVSKTRWRPSQVHFFGGDECSSRLPARVAYRAALAFRKRRPAPPAPETARG